MLPPRIAQTLSSFSSSKLEEMIENKSLSSADHSKTGAEQSLPSESAPGALSATPETQSSVKPKKNGKKKISRRKMISVNRDWTDEELLLMQEHSDQPDLQGEVEGSGGRRISVSKTTSEPPKSPLALVMPSITENAAIAATSDDINSLTLPSHPVKEDKIPEFDFNMEALIQEMRSLIKKETGKVVPAPIIISHGGEPTVTMIDPFANDDDPPYSLQTRRQSSIMMGRSSREASIIATRRPSHYQQQHRIQDPVTTSPAPNQSESAVPTTRSRLNSETGDGRRRSILHRGPTFHIPPPVPIPVTANTDIIEHTLPPSIQEPILENRRISTLAGYTPQTAGKDHFFTLPSIASSKRISIVVDHGFALIGDEMGTEDAGAEKAGPNRKEAPSFRNRLMQAVNSSMTARLEAEKREKERKLLEKKRKSVIRGGAMFKKYQDAQRRHPSISQAQRKLDYLKSIKWKEGPQIKDRLPPCPKVLENLVIWKEIPQTPLDVAVEKRLERDEDKKIKEEKEERGVCIGDDGWNLHLRQSGVDPREQLAQLSEKMKKLILITSSMGV